MKLIIICLLLSSFINAQQKSLSIGDTLSKEHIHYLQSYTNSPLGAGGIIVLDFMATTCPGCIKLLPHFDSLQKQFQNKLQFILVTAEKKEKTTQFFTKNRIVKKLQLPVIAEDTLLRSLFPHTFISHEVWICKNKVIAITKGEYVTGANITAVLSGVAIKLPVKTDLTNYDYWQPLFAASTGIEPQISNLKPRTSNYYSGFTQTIEGYTRGYKYTTDSTTATQRFIFINYNLQEFFLKSYSLPLVYPQQFIEWKTKPPPEDYCYEAVLPLSLTKEQCWQKIREDIGTYFNLKASVEKRDNAYLIIAPRSQEFQ